MLKKNIITKELINKLSYSDFIGLINQWNTPPGAYSTLSKLAIFSRLNNSSRLLEVGCSTGFSIRELVNMSGCRGVGFDISKKSVNMAIYNKNRYSKNTRVSFIEADGYKFKTNVKYSHILVGGNLKFFSDPTKMLSLCIKMLKDNGYILATPYYQNKKIPRKLAKKMHRLLGLPLNKSFNSSYKETMRLFNNLEIMYEDRNTLELETEKEINYYCRSTIERACKIYNITNKEIYNAMYNRLLKIRSVINESRRYQGYCVLVLRYRKSVYPNRYVGLF